ncbi:MAG: isoquinoline 1-oxidoreductase beta subunit [Saprospiraceae bacterium]|jgi:isoquinoline 1-oxidoreductase beta subunit|tara:strand:+ start:676 stop:2961 length:2286 start_codon:yes stop_codon:yes gene_type:complete
MYADVAHIIECVKLFIAQPKSTLANNHLSPLQNHKYMSIQNDEDKQPKSKSRRKFLIKGGLGTLGLLAVGTYVFRNPLRRQALGIAEGMIPPYSGSGTKPNLWFEITKENKILLHSPKVEMGQGTFTGLAQIVADEMGVDINMIEVTTAATSTGVVDGLGTGGSLSMAQLFTPLREMAATMREMLAIEAAKLLGVAKDDMNVENGIFSAAGKQMTYAQVASQVNEWEVPDVPTLKLAKDYKYIGKPISRIDQIAKIKGDPIYGMDVTMPDMVYATVIRPEHVGGKLKSADISAAKNMAGVVKIVENENWIGVIADSYVEALMAKNKVKVEWDVPKTWTEQGIRDILKVGMGNKMITQKEGSALEENDTDMITMEFTSPIGAHAQIEPNGAVAHVKDGKATIKLSTQVIGITQKQVADALGMDLENVNVIGTYLGGGFGRRLNTSHAIETAMMSKAVGRPVKYFFTRKEEFQNDTFRPPTHHIMKGKMNSNGILESLEHHYASGDVAINSVLMPSPLHTVLGTDIGAMRGANIMYKDVTNHRAVQWHTTLPFATSWWRSLGLLANTFAIESFIAEMAIKAGVHPVDFRLSILSNEDIGPRIKKVLQEAARIANYTDEVIENRAMGIALSTDTGSPCAHVVEVMVKGDKISVEKVTCVLDCGLAVNPDQVKAQCEGSIIMGLSASLHEKMTLKDGKLSPTIYGAYDMALMKDAPKQIDVHLIQGVDVPLPVGEPPMGPIGAAIGNAVRRITGKRLTDLPLSLS